jgi:hypothetical protein
LLMRSSRSLSLGILSIIVQWVRENTLKVQRDSGKGKPLNKKGGTSASYT